jgi:ATP-dependent RNA helicase RhlB
MGTAFSLVGDKDIDSLSRIEDFLKHKVEIGYLENSQLIQEFKPFPSYFDSHYPKSLDRSPRHGAGASRERTGERRPRTNAGPDRGPRFDKKGPRNAGEERKPQDHLHSAGEPRSEVDQKAVSKPQYAHKRTEVRSQNGTPAKKQEAGRKPGAYQHARRAPVAARPKGVGQKIAGFFKKLFS